MLSDCISTAQGQVPGDTEVGFAAGDVKATSASVGPPDQAPELMANVTGWHLPSLHP